MQHEVQATIVLQNGSPKHIHSRFSKGYIVGIYLVVGASSSTVRHFARARL